MRGPIVDAVVGLWPPPGGEGGSRYEGSFAPCTSRGGRVAGVVGRRGGLLRVIQRAAGCGASSSVRSATVGGSVAFSRYLGQVEVRGGGGGGVTALCTRQSCYKCVNHLINHHPLSKRRLSYYYTHIRPTDTRGAILWLSASLGARAPCAGTEPPSGWRGTRPCAMQPSRRVVLRVYDDW